MFSCFLSRVQLNCINALTLCNDSSVENSVTSIMALSSLIVDKHLIVLETLVLSTQSKVPGKIYGRAEQHHVYLFTGEL